MCSSDISTACPPVPAVGIHLSDKPLFLQPGHSYNFMENQWCFFPTFNYEKGHYVSLCTFQVMERWASSIKNQTVPFSPIFCPLRASCCWPSLRFCPFAEPTEGEREGRDGGTSLETGLGDSRAKAEFREEPISRATLPNPLISQFNLEIKWGYRGYRSLVWAGGRRIRNKHQEWNENQKYMEEGGHFWWH